MAAVVGESVAPPGTADQGGGRDATPQSTPSARPQTISTQRGPAMPIQHSRTPYVTSTAITNVLIYVMGPATLPDVTVAAARRTISVSDGPEQQHTALGATEAYLGLLALKVADDEGWCRYVATEPTASGRHILEVPGLMKGSRKLRALTRGEAYWWAMGFGDGYGDGQLIADLAREPIPELVPVAQAMDLIPAVDRWGSMTQPWMSLAGIRHNIDTGRFYPIYGVSGRTQYMFRAQIIAEAASRYAGAARSGAADLIAAGDSGAAQAQQRAAEAERHADQTAADWQAIRERLPQRISPAQLGLTVTLRPSPDPLPVPSVYRTQASRHVVRALMIGDQETWFGYRNPAGDSYLVDVTDANDIPIRRSLPASSVLAWVLGMADYHGRSDLVAYRDGQG